jgi:hypothetical protein
MSANHEPSPSNPQAGRTALIARLAAMVVKTGLGLAQMTDGDRLLALALPAHRLPVGHQYSESEVNELLKASLETESAFLRTDHVELRRWLVDTGWWRRDGFGRAYTRPPAHEVPEHLQAFATGLANEDLVTWALQQMKEHRAAQQARRARWNAHQETLRQGAAPHDAVPQSGP